MPKSSPSHPHVKRHLVASTSGRSKRNTAACIAKMIRALFPSPTKPVLIAVGGPGGTGKSTFSAALVRELSQNAPAQLLPLDDYKTARAERASKHIYGAHPDANNIPLLSKHLKAIQHNKAFEQPVYDVITGTIDTTKTIQPASYTILDGEISTYPHFRDYIDFSLFIDSDWKTQLNTRITRDINERNYTQEKALSTFLQSNLREFSQYGAEGKEHADIHLYCHDDYRLEIESIAENHLALCAPLLKENHTSLDLEGLIVPVPTPFTSKGDIDTKAFIHHLEFLATAGVHRILISGTTGEFFSLNRSERRTLLKIALRYFPGMIIYHASMDNLKSTILNAQWAQDYGADAIISHGPYYFAHAPSAGIIEYYTQLGASLTIPLMLYNYEDNTNNPLTTEILNAVPHSALKDCSANFDLLPSTPQYFISEDSQIVSAYAKGACGFISAAANINPSTYVSLEEALRSGKDELAQSLQLAVSKHSASFSGNTAIPALKQSLSQTLTNYPPYVRAPLVTMPPK